VPAAALVQGDIYRLRVVARFGAPAAGVARRAAASVRLA
jgi:hypothetical protein